MSEDEYTQEDYQFEKLSSLAMADSLTAEQSEYVFSHGIDEINYYLASNPNTSPEILVSLSRSEFYNEMNDELTSWRAIENPSFPVDVLSKIVNTENKSAVTKSPNLTPELARKLYDFNDEDIRNSLAANPLTPVDILVKLYKRNPYNSYDMALASNPSLPFELLEEFIAFGKSWILLFVLRNPSVDVNVFADIIVASVDLMKDLAKRNRTPLPILRKIYEQKEKFSPDDYREIITSLICNRSNTDLSMLEELFENGDEYIRLQVAVNPNISHELINKLLALNISEINYSILGNPATPAHILSKYASKPGYSGVVAANPNVSVECLDKLLLSDLSYDEAFTLLKNEVVTPKIVQRLILEGREWDNVSELAFKHPLARIDDIVASVYTTETPNHTIFYLLDREEKAFPLFKKYMEEKYETDITTMPNSLICDLMDWEINFTWSS
jgi:hypothetical protein